MRAYMQQQAHWVCHLIQSETEFSIKTFQTLIIKNSRRNNFPPEFQKRIRIVK